MRLDEGLEDQKLSLDITPLIDIIFLLVLFFAVSTSFISGEDLEALQTDAVTFKAESERLVTEVEDKNERIGTLETDFTRMVAEKTEEIARLARNVEKADGQAAKLEFMVAALDNQRIDLEGELKTRDDKNATLESQLENAYQDFNNLNAELTTVKSEAERQAEQERLLRGLLAERDAEKTDIETERNAASAERDALRTQKVALVEQLAMVRGFMDEREAKTIATSKALASERDDMAAQLAATTAAVAQLNQTLAARQSEINASKTDLDAAAAKEILLQKLIADKAAELDGMRVRLESADAARGELDAALEDSQREVKASREELAVRARTADTEILRLQAELNKYREVASLDREQIERILKAQEQLREGMSSYLADNSLDIKRDRQRLTLQLSDKILFPSGSPNIKPEGLRVLRNLGKILKERMSQLQVQIGGHTDNIPVGGRRGALSDNWGLSAARAVNVVRFFEEDVGIDAQRMAAVGYGEHRPVADNSNTAGRAQNRRIEIVLIPR